MKKFWQMSGPITLLAAYALAAALPLASFPFDLFLAGAAGFYFCSRFRLKGCSYALMLLSLSGILGHLFLETHHFLRLGLEASFACSFFAAALTFEQDDEARSAIESQLASRAAVIQNLEEEMGKARELQLETQMSLTAKIDELRKNFEEIAAEKSSLEILNDVLRKSNAAHFAEKGALDTLALEKEQRWAKITGELEQRRLELSHLKEAAKLAASRAVKEIEELKADRSESCIRLAAAEQKAQELSHLKGAAEIAANRSVKEIEELKADRLESRNCLAAAEKKVHELAAVEALHRQLKAQFEEKGRVLHETRSLLFKAETDLQSRAIEKEEQNSFLPEEMRAEMDRFDEELGRLEEENRHLQDLVTQLTNQPQSVSFAVHRTPLPAGKPSFEETLREALIPKRKKKTKKPAQQDLLF